MIKKRCGRGIVKYCIESEELCSHYLIFPMEYQTGEVRNFGRCADWWNAKLQLEANKQSIGLQAAVESFRNEMVKPNPGLLSIAKIFREELEKKRIILEYKTEKLIGE